MTLAISNAVWPIAKQRIRRANRAIIIVPEGNA